MSEVKFTNGEWVLVSTDFAGEFELTTEERIDDSKVPILTIDTGYIDVIGEEQKANAHLIAAAPDMYEALLLIDQADKMISEGVNVHGGMSTLQGQISMISEILAKARGESV